jgi:hypothetical protein
MKNYLSDKNNIYLNYADAVYQDFMQTRFGVKGCTPVGNVDLFSARKDLVEWQQNEDNGALTQTSISYITWLGVNYDLEEIEMTNTGAGYVQTPNPMSPQNLTLQYNYANGESQNIIEVNTGGCVTRINLNPSIQINHSTTATFVYVQETPAYVWEIEHNLGYSPNVFIQDTNGVDIEGVVDSIDGFILTVSFTSPVAGTAYLS